MGRPLLQRWPPGVMKRDRRNQIQHRLSTVTVFLSQRGVPYLCCTRSGQRLHPVSV